HIFKTALAPGDPGRRRGPYSRRPEAAACQIRIGGMRLRRLQHVSSPFPNGRQDEVRAFYENLLGLKEILVPHSLKDLGLVWFSAGADALELHFFPGMPDPEHPRHLCLEVEDLQALRRQLQAAGYRPYDDIPIPNRPRFF